MDENKKEKFIIEDETAIAAGDFIFGAPDLIEGIIRKVGLNRAVLNKRLKEIIEEKFGKIPPGLKLTYNYLTREIDFWFEDQIEEEDDTAPIID